jgi:hypothetical protein
MDIMECTRMSAELVGYDEIRTFFEDGWIDEVLFPVKSGKEATVYCCRASKDRGDAYFALKAYRQRQHRNFRNAAIYQEGRVLGDARTTRAVTSKSRFDAPSNSAAGCTTSSPCWASCTQPVLPFHGLSR